MQSKKTFTNDLLLLHHKKYPMSRQQSQKCASLAAIPRYNTIIYTTGPM